MVVVAEAEVVLVLERSRVDGAQDIPVEHPDSVPLRPANADRRVITETDFGHDRSWFESKDDGARFQQGLEVGHDLRPAAGNADDELRVVALNGMSDGELYGFPGWLELHRAEGIAFGLELRLVHMPPADDQAPGRVGFDDFAGVGDFPVGVEHFPRRAGGPLAFAVHAEPVLLLELRVGQRRPQLLRGRADVGDVDEGRLRHESSPDGVSGPPAPSGAAFRTSQSSGRRARAMARGSGSAASPGRVAWCRRGSPPPAGRGAGSRLAGSCPDAGRARSGSGRPARTARPRASVGWGRPGR